MHTQESTIGYKYMLLVDFTPLALYKTISFHFLKKVTLGKLSTRKITSLRTLNQTVEYMDHVGPCMCRRSVHFGKKAVMS